MFCHGSHMKTASAWVNLHLKGALCASSYLKHNCESRRSFKSLMYFSLQYLLNVYFFFFKSEENEVTKEPIYCPCSNKW